MSALTCVLFFVCLVSAGVSEKVPVPENVRVVSVNMGLALEWDPPQSPRNTLFHYTAEMSGWERKYKPVCLNSSSLRCDFSDHVTIFGSYKLRVRAEFDGDTSDWVETEDLPLDKITMISAPRVQLQSQKAQTEVDITDPVLKTRNVREVFGDISYLIRFWKYGETKKEELKTQQNRFILPKLEPLVKYCVEVEIVYFFSRSQTSNITCITNTRSNEVEAWVIATVLLVSFLVVLVAVVLIFLVVWFGYRGYGIVFPDADLPEDLKKFLSKRSQPSILPSMENKEHCCELRILHKEPNSPLDSQQTEEPTQTQKSEGCTGADVKSEMIITTEQKPLLDEMSLQ